MNGLLMRDFGPLRCAFEEGPPGAPLFVALHGRGGNSLDIALLGHTLAPKCHRLFPDGRLPWPLDVPATGRAWYTRDEAQRAGEIALSRDALLECLAEARGSVACGPAILLGFSQGAVMTLDIGLRDGGPASLLIALSGFLFEDLGGPSSPPTLIAHGTADDVIPVARGREAHGRLKKRGVRVTYRELPTDHSIRHVMIAAIRGFLRESGLIPNHTR